MKKMICSLMMGMAVYAGSIAHTQTGQPDSTFGSNGKVTNAPDSATYSDYTLLADERIVVGIKEQAGSNAGGAHFFARCFLSDGGIDSSYGTHGTSSYIHLPGPAEMLNRIAAQPDGKILLVGIDVAGSKENMLVARLNANGTVDSAFGDNGIKVIPVTLAGTDGAFALLVLNDGKILLGGRAGTSPAAPALVRLLPDGTPDASFGTGGIVVIGGLGFFSYIWDMKLQADGKIVADLARLDGTPIPFTVLRLNADGSKDNSYGNNGLVQVAFDSHVASNRMAMQPDNKVIIAGGYQDPLHTERQRIALMRLNSDGSLDATFGAAGKVVTGVSFSVNAGVAPLVQPVDGKILAAAMVRHSSSGRLNFLTLRYLPDGSPDMEWGSAGYIEDSFALNKNHFATNIFYTAAGKVLVAGTYNQAPLVNAVAMVRYNSCGITITGQPADQSRQTGATATFTVAGSAAATYQWQRQSGAIWTDLVNGGQYSGVTTATLAVTNLTLADNNARFRTVARSGACADTSLAALLTVTPSTGIKGPDLHNLVAVYPNPAGALLTIDGRQAQVHLASVTVRDLPGRIVAWRDGRGADQLTLATEKWSPGIYFISVVSREGAMRTFKITKR